nr:hypothetical protein [uncultured Fusobacterium sp.]
MIKNNKVSELEKLKKLQKIADKYGLNIDEKYPVSENQCEGEWEEVE